MYTTANISAERACASGAISGTALSLASSAHDALSVAAADSTAPSAAALRPAGRPDCGGERMHRLERRELKEFAEGIRRGNPPRARLADDADERLQPAQLAHLGSRAPVAG